MPIEMPDDENSDVLRHMHANGDALTAPRDIDFSIVFAEEEAARTFSATIENAFDRVRYSEIEQSRRLRWDVTATKWMVPTHAEITGIEEWLAAKAEPLGGRNDGWGCFNITETAAPDADDQSRSGAPSGK